MEVYEVILTNLNSKEELTIQVEVDENETTEDIVIKVVVFWREVVVSNYNYLPAYQEFRDKLLQLGLGIKCNGSRLNAVQSGMMGGQMIKYISLR